MSQQVMATQAARIGKWKGEILLRAIPVEVLQLAGTQKQMPRNVSDTVVYRRWVPYGGTTGNPNQFYDNAGNAESEAVDDNRVDVRLTAHLTTEGVTPTPDSMVAQDITVTLKQYACLYSFTDKVADLYEDDISDAMKTQVGERMALIREWELYAKLRASTNRFYGGAGSSLATVAGKLTAKMLRKIARSLAVNHGKKITQVLGATDGVGTKPIEAAYIVFAHSDIEADLRDTTAFPGYTPVAEYGNRKPIHEHEIGSFEQFRIVVSPELIPYQSAGALIGSTGCVSSLGTNIDVYPVMVVAQEAYGTVSLRGSKSFDLSVIAVGNKDSADPLGQRGYIGTKFYAASTLLNQQWMALALVGAGDLA